MSYLQRKLPTDSFVTPSRISKARSSGSWLETDSEAEKDDILHDM